VCGYEQGEAKKFAHRAALTFALWFGLAAVVLAVAAAPAEADKKRNPAEKSGEESIPDPANGEPLTLVIALNEQTIDIYRGTSLIKSSKVSSGTRGYATMAGVFTILEKRRHHHSNMYSGAPMPWMQRLTWSGTALHGGVLPGYPASHGCVRVSFSFAPKLFRITNVGEHVVIGNERITPTLITHPILFQPLAPIPQTEISSEGLESPDSGGSAQTAEANGLTEQTADDPAAPERTERAPQGVESGSKAKERPSTPLRILVTRRTQRDRIISVQHTLAALGHLKPQKFTGRLGKETIAAIKAFQRASGLRETGEFNDELAKEIYRAAGKAEPPEGHLFVRQNFRPLFDVPVAVRDPEQTLGTHVFIALNFAPGDTTTRWLSMSLESDDAGTVLDRIHIPEDMRQKISERLTPGSSLIIGDKSVNSATLPDGADFLVLTKDSPAVAANPPAKVKHAKLKKARSKPSKWRRSARTYAYQYLRRFDRPRFFRWRRW
jgi:lipoprotein-anchoring transpeptidase ErfK/SrfK/peptidoglycan hydrolase-like protein with peptidoglycan-binding domain